MVNSPDRKRNKYIIQFIQYVYIEIVYPPRLVTLQCVIHNYINGVCVCGVFLFHLCSTQKRLALTPRATSWWWLGAYTPKSVSRSRIAPKYTRIKRLLVPRQMCAAIAQSKASSHHRALKLNPHYMDVYTNSMLYTRDNQIHTAIRGSEANVAINMCVHIAVYIRSVHKKTTPSPMPCRRRRVFVCMCTEYVVVSTLQPCHQELPQNL